MKKNESLAALVVMVLILLVAVSSLTSGHIVESIFYLLLDIVWCLTVIGIMLYKRWE